MDRRKQAPNKNNSEKHPTSTPGAPSGPATGTFSRQPASVYHGPDSSILYTIANTGNSSRDKLLATLEQLLAIEAMDLDTVLNQASTLVAAALDCEKADTFLYDPSISSLIAHGTSDTPMGRKQRQLGLGTLPLANAGNTVAVFLNGTPYLSGHVDQDPSELIGIKDALGVRSAVKVVLDVGGERRGVVQVDSALPEKFTQEDVHFLEAVSRWLGIVTHRAELVEKVTRESAQQASRETAEELLEVMAHDMNNYLTPLGGWIGVLAQRAHRDENKRYLSAADAALTSFNRLRELVTDLLDVRRLQYGLLSLSLETVDLVELVGGVTGSMQTSKLGILLQVEDNELYVQADPSRIRQVLENLISNALKFTPPDEPVKVTLSREAGHGGGGGNHDGQEWATITVHDDGPGISQERMLTLFDRYSAGPESSGLGLGLYLARSIAEAHRGTLTVESNPGQGTTFRLSLRILPVLALGEAERAAVTM